MKRLILLLGLLLALAHPCLAEESGITGEYRDGNEWTWMRAIALPTNSDKFLPDDCWSSLSP